jgi:hypothetical protein
MNSRRRRDGPRPDRRRALELLASCRDGCAEAIMLAHGFTVEQMVELVRAGLATAKAERVVAGGRTIDVARVRITEAGRQAIAARRAIVFAASGPARGARMAQDSAYRRFFFNAQKKNFEGCLHPSMNCPRPAIRAHSVQNRRVLDLIQQDGHVMMLKYKVKGDDPILEFEKVGRNEASTFTGLCSEHDTELFKVIDTEPLNVDNEEHLRLLAYRSVIRDLHTNIEQGNRLWLLDQELVKATGGDPREVVSVPFLCALEFYEKAKNVYKYRRTHFDRPLEQGKQPDLKHSVLELPNQAPVLAVSALFSTSHSEQGDIIGPTLNIVPMNEKRTAVILSCPTEQENSVKEALKTTCQAEDDRLRHEISKLIIQRVENFVLSPKHYNSWSADRQKRIVQEFERALFKPEALQDHEDLMLF